ncbi:MULTISPECIES: hypothetical protein [Paraburkholderia]|uniref:Uncharacterized protein n=1 Tax=Paraburkholderia podalyriae TaxID=1938811 RepID=A0ABR7PYF7_9BURK|nr:hypothetical protein [Paraburkholderia podalyriae]MBC8751288.1 hypothetical protein [Paraburkholderia podalyriae]
MKGAYFDIATASFGAISAVLWAWSAKVGVVDLGFDNDVAVNKAMKLAGRLNGSAAAFASLAAVTQAAKAFAVPQ